MIDLHTHSKISDGSLNPSTIISCAKEEGLSVLALTDHDSVDGILEAASAAEKANIVFVPGTELNIEWNTGEFHLLGLGLKEIDKSLENILADLMEGRISRNKIMIEKMRDDGFDVSYSELCETVGNSYIGRPHFAEYFVKKGFVKNRQQAFDKFLAHGRPYYEKRIGCNLDDAISAIFASGGVPVLAHPLSLYVSWGKMEGVLQNLYARGVRGIEAYHPGARVGECLRLEELGRKLGFFITAGSDFHGKDVRKDRRLGYTCGNRKIEDRFWYEELLPFLDKNTV